MEIKNGLNRKGFARVIAAVAFAFCCAFAVGCTITKYSNEGDEFYHVMLSVSEVHFKSDVDSCLVTYTDDSEEGFLDGKETD